MKCMIKTLAALHFIFFCGLAVDAASPQARLETYQKEIRGKDSGVYEIGGDLYVHVKLPIDKADSSGRAKMKAVLAANELLKKWAIDYTAEGRKRNCTLSDGWWRAMSVLDAIAPNWRFSNWDMNLAGQELSGRDGESLWFGQIVSKDDFVQKIPALFLSPDPDTEVITACLKCQIPKALKVNASKLFATCGVWDLIDETKCDSLAHKEYLAVNKRLDEYRKKAPLIVRFAHFACRHGEQVGEGTKTPKSRKAVAVYFDSVSSLEQKRLSILDALCESPGDVQLWNMYGQILMRQEDFLGALSCFRMALCIASTDQFALTNIALAYDSLGYDNLAWGYAVLSVGSSQDKWCQTRCTAILGNDTKK